MRSGRTTSRTGSIKARFTPKASRRLSPGNPQWSTTALRFALGLQWPRKRAETLLKEGAAIEPLYQHLYVNMATFLLPRWYGEGGEWERFATETANRIGGVEGSAVYNQIALRMAVQYTAKAFFHTNDVSWRKLQWSFADREKLYGTGVQSLNAMCWLSAGVDDKTAARAFMKRIGGQWDQSVWKRRDYFDSFNRWLDGE